MLTHAKLVRLRDMWPARPVTGTQSYMAHSGSLGISTEPLYFVYARRLHSYASGVSSLLSSAAYQRLLK